MKDDSVEKKEDRHFSDSGDNLKRFLPLDEFEVTCIRQEETSKGRYRIAQLGVRLGDEIILIDVPVAVFLIQTGKRFYVDRAGTKTFLRTMVSSSGHPYVETKEDSTHLNNLKSLPTCRAGEEKKPEKDEPASDPTPELEETTKGPVDRLSRAGWSWLLGTFALLTLCGLAILFSIIPVFDLEPKYYTITAIAFLFLIFLGVFTFREASREVYAHFFQRSQRGWLGLTAFLLLFILLLILVYPKSPTITFDPVPDKVYLDPDFRVNAAVSDGRIISFKTTTDSFCSVTKDGLVHIINAGGCAITANSEPNARVSTVTRTFTIYRKSQTLNFAMIPDMVYGDLDFPLSAAADSTLPVSFTVSGDCSSRQESVHILSAGSCTVTAHQSGNENYLPAQEINQNFRIAKKSQTIDLPGLSEPTSGQSFVPFNATASSGLPVSVEAENLSICTTDENVVKLVDTGTCTITISQPGNENYLAAPEVIQTFPVNPIPPLKKNDQTISFGPLSSTVFGSPDSAISASASSGLAVSFTALGKCSVTGGSVKITGAGSCIITAHQDGNDFTNPAESVSQTLTIAKATPVIFWQNPDEIMLGTRLGPAQLFASAGAVNWNGGHPYASVSGTYTYTPSFGTILPAGIHPLRVVFTPSDQDNFTGNEMTVHILVVTSHESE